jgi:hypothetical protein
MAPSGDIVDKTTYDAMTAAEIDSTIDRLLPHGAGTVTEPRLRQALDVLAQRIASNTRAYELLGIRTADEMAEEWRVSRRRAQAYIAMLHERFGVGRKIGNVWCLSAEEAGTHRPAENAGRPKRRQPNDKSA